MKVCKFLWLTGVSCNEEEKGEVLIDSDESPGSHSIPKDECCLGSVPVEDSD